MEQACGQAGEVSTERGRGTILPSPRDPKLPLLYALTVGRAFGADLDTFRPGSGLAGEGGFQLTTPTVGRFGASYGGLIASYAANPVVPSGEGSELAPALRHLVGGRFVGGYSFGTAFRLDLDVPAYWVGFSDDGLSGPALGDVRARGVVSLVHGAGRGEGLALLPSVSLPTGSEARLVGANGVGVGFGAAMGLRLASPLLFTANLGVDTGPASDLSTEPVGSALYGGAALEWDATRTVSVGAEVDAVVDLSSGYLPEEGNPVEAHAYTLFGPETGLAGTLGVGTALVRGLGAPDLRLVVGLAWRVTGAVPVRDRDRDGLVDHADACPTEAEDSDGYADTDGCPDADDDGDGVLDPLDACRDRAEDRDAFEDNDGCPELDNDRDGSVDGADACPTQKGPVETGGCPDTDTDGISDTVDLCPMFPGPAETVGCPDTDRDGLADAVDLCPTDPAYAPADGSAHTGCPATAELRGDTVFVRDSVRFVAGSAQLEAVPNPNLDAVARLLNTHPEIRRLEVAAHTDAEGDRAANLALSQARAEAVVKYLITAGRVDPSRLLAVGYGDRTPVDTNETAAGRARNRRVEFVVR